ncbi:hypothetical protein SNEBB_001485 [Seison nebaliae]|nr:hypothetical protein SNEBB_001485 [Seison nebaliae]
MKRGHIAPQNSYIVALIKKFESYNIRFLLVNPNTIEHSRIIYYSKSFLEEDGDLFNQYDEEEIENLTPSTLNNCEVHGSLRNESYLIDECRRLTTKCEKNTVRKAEIRGLPFCVLLISFEPSSFSTVIDEDGNVEVLPSFINQYHDRQSFTSNSTCQFNPFHKYVINAIKQGKNTTLTDLLCESNLTSDQNIRRNLHIIPIRNDSGKHLLSVVSLSEYDMETNINNNLTENEMDETPIKNHKQNINEKLKNDVRRRSILPQFNEIQWQSDRLLKNDNTQKSNCRIHDHLVTTTIDDVMKRYQTFYNNDDNGTRKNKLNIKYSKEGEKSAEKNIFTKNDKFNPDFPLDNLYTPKNNNTDNCDEINDELDNYEKTMMNNQKELKERNVKREYCDWYMEASKSTSLMKTIHDRLFSCHTGITNRLAEKLQKVLTFGDENMSNEFQLDPMQQPRAKCTILHYSIFKTIWDWIILFFVIYTAVSTPYHAAFLIESGEEESDKVKAVMTNIDYAVDVLFVLDILINFRTTYVNEKGELISEQIRIAKKYLTGWFVIDLLAAIPFDLILKVMIEDIKKIPTLVGLLKTARLLRLIRVARKMDRYSEYGGALLGLLTCGFALIAHWLACIWYAIGHAERRTEYGQIGWLMQLANMTNQPYDATKRFSGPSIKSRYVTALYFTLSSLTSVGFGNVSPNTNNEKIFSVCVMMIGSLMYASIFGNVSAIIQRLYNGSARYHTQMLRLKEFIRTHQLPVPICQRIEDYFHHMWSYSNGVDTNTVLRSFPESLQGDICLHLNWNLFASNKVFKGLSYSFLRLISTRVRAVRCPPGETLINQDDPLNVIYFLTRGSIEIFQQPNYDFDVSVDTGNMPFHHTHHNVKPHVIDMENDDIRFVGNNNNFSDKISNDFENNQENNSLITDEIHSMKNSKDINGNDINTTLIAIITNSDSFGENPVRHKTPGRSHSTVRTLTHCLVHRLSATDLLDALHAYPEYTSHFRDRLDITVSLRNKKLTHCVSSMQVDSESIKNFPDISIRNELMRKSLNQKNKTNNPLQPVDRFNLECLHQTDKKLQNSNQEISYLTHNDNNSFLRRNNAFNSLIKRSKPSDADCHLQKSSDNNNDLSVKTIATDITKNSDDTDVDIKNDSPNPPTSSSRQNSDKLKNIRSKSSSNVLFSVPRILTESNKSINYQKIEQKTTPHFLADVNYLKKHLTPKQPNFPRFLDENDGENSLPINPNESLRVTNRLYLQKNLYNSLMQLPQIPRTTEKPDDMEKRKMQEIISTFNHRLDKLENKFEEKMNQILKLLSEK